MPQGLKLARGKLIRWGDTKSVAIAAFTPLPLQCYGGGGLETCSAERDPNIPPPFSDVTLTFNQGKLYEVHLRVVSEEFDAVESEMTTALAQKPNQQTSILQNGFGARFDQVIDFRQADHVVLLLEKRDPHELEVTVLMMRYIPLAPNEEVKKKVVPF